MIKIFGGIIMLCTSLPCVAHMQSPNIIGGKDNILEAMTFYQHNVVNVKVGNLYKTPKSYNIYLNDKFVENTGKIYYTGVKNFSVKVSINAKGVPETHTICSISVLENGENVRTKLCTKVQMMWIDN